MRFLRSLFYSFFPWFFTPLYNIGDVLFNKELDTEIQILNIQEGYYIYSYLINEQLSNNVHILKPWYVDYMYDKLPKETRVYKLFN